MKRLLACVVRNTSGQDDNERVHSIEQGLTFQDVHLRSNTMMHDPIQAYAALGSIYGMQTPYGILNNPAALSQLGIPQMAQSPFGQYGGQGQIGPQQLQQQLQQLQQQQLQQLQLAQLLGISPLSAGFQNPLLAAW